MAVKSANNISPQSNVLEFLNPPLQLRCFFGLGHYYGYPSGVLGVLLSSFLGWFLGKSLLETKGFFWAWLIHFVPDVFIFIFLAILA